MLRRHDAAEHFKHLGPWIERVHDREAPNSFKLKRLLHCPPCSSSTVPLLGAARGSRIVHISYIRLQIRIAHDLRYDLRTRHNAVGRQSMELINGASTFQFTLGFGAISIAIWNEYVVKKSEFIRAVAELHSENESISQHQLATAENFWKTAMAAPLTRYLNVFVLASLFAVSLISFVFLTVSAIYHQARVPSSAFICFSVYSIGIIPGMILFLRWLQRRILLAIKNSSTTEYSKISFSILTELRQEFQTIEDDLATSAEGRVKTRQR